MKRLRLAVIGVGHLGKEHARILAGMSDVDLVGVADVNAEQAESVARRLGTKHFVESWPLLNLVDAACIVVPTSCHEAAAADFLRRGLHMLIEKPLASTLQAAQRLTDLAEQSGAILQVGHIERFNPAFEEIQGRSLQPKYIRAERLSSFTGRSVDIGVVLDLMIHDLDLILALVRSPVGQVESQGICVFGANEDMASARIRFENGCVADVAASRAHPEARRQMHIWGPEGYAGLDFAGRSVTLVQPSEQVRRHGLDPARLDPASRSRLKEELFDRHLETLTIDCRQQDQLTCELRQFLDCIRNNRQPLVSGQVGCDAIALAERILGCMSRHAWNSASSGTPGAWQPPPASLFVKPVKQDVA